MSTPFLIFIGLMLVAMFIFNSRARKRMAEQEKKAEERRKEMMVPGAWVRLRSGFWGRFVDQDGEIVILETPGGDDTYWDQRAILDVLRNFRSRALMQRKTTLPASLKKSRFLAWIRRTTRPRRSDPEGN